MTAEEELEVVLRSAIAGARPDPELRVDVWAEEHMQLPKSGPTGGGAYRFDRTPYARRIHQVLSPSHPAKRVVAKVASQMFKTQTAINWLCAVAHSSPANILALQPTDSLAKRFSARMSQAIKAVPILKNVFAAERSRDKRNTTGAKDFHGDSTLYITTAGSAANLSEITAKYLFMDEVDRMETSVEGEGDPVEIAEARATQFQRTQKFYEVSSPTIRGFSKIDALYERGTMESYHVPCPSCGHLHELVLENFRYERDQDTGFMGSAWFVCPENGCIIREVDKPEMLRDEELGGLARWVARSAGDGETYSFTMNAFYMPSGAIDWLTLARRYAYARERLSRGDHESMQVFYNTRLGLSYQNSEASTTAKQLQDRAEPYTPRVVPAGALVLTMAVDTQSNRLEVQIEAWGVGLEHWVVDFVVLDGSPADPPDMPGSVWKRLDDLRRTPFPHALGGKPILISAYGIDAGGGNTQDVYNYGSVRKHMGCTVLHGANRPNKPIMGAAPSRVDIDYGGEKKKGGVELWTVGTDVAKDYLFNRIHLTEGTGAHHFHDQLPDSWFEQLVVEQPRVTYKRGKTVREWVKPPGARNEALDLSVYNLAIAYRLGLNRWAAHDWQRLRDKLIPPSYTVDLFAPAQPAAILPAPPPPLDADPAPVASSTREPEVTDVNPKVLDLQTPTAVEVVAPVAASAENSVPVPRPAPPPPPAPLPPPPPPPAAPFGRRLRSRGIG